jgi:protein TonB
VTQHPQEAGFARGRRRLSWPLVTAIVLAHLAVLYGLARVLVPEVTEAATRQVVSAFSIAVPPPPPPPPDPSQPDQGAQAAPGPKATPKPVAAPSPRVTVRREPPAPRAAATGIDNLAGAAAAGEGTGAAGSGEGTGSGKGGTGAGGGAASKPVLLSGSIDNARDFPVPPGGRAARRGTQVIVRVTVGTDGRARDCTIYRASPDAEADRITCQLVEARLRFRPATDAAGRPVAAPFYWRQQWFR